MAATYWNGEPATAVRCIVEVGISPVPTWWCVGLQGTQRKAVVVHYGRSRFTLDDEDGSGWAKVTVGKGSPRVGSHSLPDDSVVVRVLNDDGTEP